MTTLTEQELCLAAGGADGWKTRPGSAIRSRPLKGGGVEIDWYKSNHNSTQNPMQGPYRVKKGNGYETRMVA